MAQFPDFDRGFSFVHLNARRIRNNPAGLRAELDKKNIDILLFSETFLNDLDEDLEYIFSRYNM